MVATPSTMLPLGAELPAFTPLGPRRHDLVDRGRRGAPALVVAFLCPHCPYVKHIEARFGEVTADLMDRGAAVVAVQSNAVEDYPQDGPEGMAAQAVDQRLPLPLPPGRLPGGGQGVPGRLHPGLLRVRRRAAPGLPRPVRRLPARATACPPPAPTWWPRSKRSWTEATVPEDQVPSIGCNIKWRAGNEPDYFA